MYRKSEFDTEFENMISEYEEGEFLNKYSVCYWFSNHWDLRPHNNYSDYDDDDYMRDS